MTKISVCALLACLLMAGSAVASPTIDITRVYGYYTGDGGEFTITPNVDLTILTGETTVFESFCIESSETIVPGTYSVIVNDEAVQGGENDGPVGSEGGDLLDARTAYLYAQFRDSTLAGYNYMVGVGRAHSAAALQEVIWYLEDEMEITWADGSLQDQFLTAAQEAVDSGEWVGVGEVCVLNIYTLGHAGEEDYLKQDQLVLRTVPAPGAIVLGALGSCLVGFLRRRHMM